MATNDVKAEPQQPEALFQEQTSEMVQQIAEQDAVTPCDECMDTSQPLASGGGEGGEGGDAREGSDKTKIFVGGLSWETTQTQLKEHFEQYGPVYEATLKMDQDTNKSRGFAFVVFETEEGMKAALDACPHTLHGKTVDTKKAIPHAEHQAMKNRTKKIFVGGVPVEMTEETIREYFKTFGEIDEVTLVTDKQSNHRRGFVFVTFVSMDSVDNCTDKSYHHIEGTQVEVKRATPREQNPGGRWAGERGGGGGGGRGGGGGGGGRGYHAGGGWKQGGGPPYNRGWTPYGQYGGYGGGYPQGNYGGGAAYQGGFQGYGGYGGGGGGGGEGYGYRGPHPGRYGPYKPSYNHSSSGYHPYSRQ